MRFNDRELIALCEGEVDLEGILHHMKPQSSDWSDFYQQPQFKERHFKLVNNLLFYYRINMGECEMQPLGVLVLENAQITYERAHKGIPFAFSITFRVNEKFRDNEGKHIFSCRCDEDVCKWVSTLKTHSYEYWRCEYLILKTKIQMKTNDPMLEARGSSCSSKLTHERHKEVKKVRHKQKKSTFCSHVETSNFYESYTSEKSTKVVQKTTDVVVDNLIDL